MAFFLYMLTAVYGGLIWWLSSQSDPPGPHEPFPQFDKVVHFVVYGLMAGMAWTALRRTPPIAKRRLAALVAFLFAVAFGTIDEFHQWGVPKRNFDPLDIVANATGAAGMLVFLHFWLKYVERGKDVEATRADD